MNKCREAGAYWALLHITMCLPDICAALQSPSGETNSDRYKAWCDRFASDPLFTGEERWRMRCKVLHQGRARTDKRGRYTAYAFGQPAATGETDHKRIEQTTLHLDVGELAGEMSASVEGWIEWIEANPSESESLSVEKNLPSLVSVSTTRVMKPGSIAVFHVNKTN